MEREKIKQVFTLGPASENIETLKLMVQTCGGAQFNLSFRLNMGHVSINALEDWLEKLLPLRKELETDFNIVLDLQSAKPRIGVYPEETLSLGKEVWLVLDDRSEKSGHIPVPMESFFEQAQEDEIFTLNDGKLVLEAKEVYSDKIRCKVLQAGELSSHKGINSQSRLLLPPRLSLEDEQTMKLTREIEGMEYAVSFVADGTEKALFEPHCLPLNKFTAKIEHPNSVAHLKNIAKHYQELWFCRGDYGSYIPLQELGKHQKTFVQQMQKLAQKGLGKPYLIAGGVLTGALGLGLPSRSEVVHLFDCFEAGFSGYVLSEETAMNPNLRPLLELLSTFPKK